MIFSFPDFRGVEKGGKFKPAGWPASPPRAAEAAGAQADWGPGSAAGSAAVAAAAVETGCVWPPRPRAATGTFPGSGSRGPSVARTAEKLILSR